MEHIRILLSGVSFMVYVSSKISRPHGTEKVDMAETCEVRRGFTFLTDFSKKVVLDHANPQMYQSRRTLRLRKEMSLPLTFIRPFRDNPQSCP